MNTQASSSSNEYEFDNIDKLNVGGKSFSTIYGTLSTPIFF